MKDVDTVLLNIAASKNEDVCKAKAKEKKRSMADLDTSLYIFDSTLESDSEEKKRIAKKRAKCKELKAFYKEFKEFKKSKMEAKENQPENPIPTPTPSPKTMTVHPVHHDQETPLRLPRIIRLISPKSVSV